MLSQHRTHLLFVEPQTPPTDKPINDELTKKVDFIFACLEKSPIAYRGFHTTPYGKVSDNHNYIHPNFPLVSNSLALYYIKHHRQDVSDKQIKWINELYEILQNPEKYYTLTPNSEGVYYLKSYQLKKSKEYGTAQTYAVKVYGTDTQAVINAIKTPTPAFFRQITKEEFDKEIATTTEEVYVQQKNGCRCEVYAVLK